jgi:endoglucanase
VTLRDNSAFKNALGVGEYYWGSNGQVLNKAILLLLGRSEGGAAEWETAALEQLHYILGVNIHGQSFVTGIGARSTAHPHHRPSGSDGIVAPVPGLMSGGPNHSITDDPVLAARFTSATPPALCYVDDQGSYASNEIAINWNAPLVFVAGYFARDFSGTSVPLRGSVVPNEIHLGQNYPNPFNGSTVITFSLPRGMELELQVVDILGRRVSMTNLGWLGPGDHRAVWTPDGARLSSGSYFYSLVAAGRPMSSVRSLVLLR